MTNTSYLFSKIKFANQVRVKGQNPGMRSYLLFRAGTSPNKFRACKSKETNTANIGTLASDSAPVIASHKFALGP